MSSPALSTTCKIALCQIAVGSDKAANIRRAQEAIADAVGRGKTMAGSTAPLDMVVLPEVWNSPYATSSFPVYAEQVPSVGAAITGLSDAMSSTKMLLEVAKKLGVWIVGGSIPEKGENGKLYNTCLVIDSSGKIAAKHRKVHLFDIDVPGRVTFKESDSLTAGNEVTTFSSPWGNVGVGICYDIRFPEYAMLLRQKGCRLLVYPGAFNMVTGPAHWELLQRARAVDNQLFVAACSPARNASSGYVAWGHSSVVNPWGEVVAKAGYEDETIFATLDFGLADTMRENIPCWKQKRSDIYELKEK